MVLLNVNPAMAISILESPVWEEYEFALCRPLSLEAYRHLFKEESDVLSLGDWPDVDVCTLTHWKEVRHMPVSGCVGDCFHSAVLLFRDLQALIYYEPYARWIEMPTGFLVRVFP